MKSYRSFVVLAVILPAFVSLAQVPFSPAKEPGVWNPDNGDGTYRNPIIYADYSDPDVIRVDEDYYLVASSMSHFPGLPVLHSRDLVNWKIIGHAVQQYPFPEFDKPQHGSGIWAPSIRFHNGEYMVYSGDPDHGILVTKAKNPSGPWEPLRLIRKVTGWIDPCPLWDDDGNAYLVHAFANSRAGIKSILAVNRMSPDGMTVLDDGIIVFVGHQTHPTIEGPKFYKRNGYYYIFAPAGGVRRGWQTVLRSKNIFGPYEYRNVLAQGRTRINGPHQGAWVDTKSGEDWFVHFQDRSAYGRITHLQPMRWENDWPVIGVNQDSAGCGEPVITWKKPDVGAAYPMVSPQTSDEFEMASSGLQWQWQANGQSGWCSLTGRPGWLRLFVQSWNLDTNLYRNPALLLQKFPAPSFRMTAELDATGLRTGERSGLIVFGFDYAHIVVERDTTGYAVVQSVCKKADTGSAEEHNARIRIDHSAAWLRVEVRQESDTALVPRVMCTFSYSSDGSWFRPAGGPFEARQGFWVGAKAGLFAIAHDRDAPRGFADYARFVVEGR